jgi:branched-chain amino acid transport system permease protein
MRSWTFFFVALGAGAVFFAASLLLGSDYLFFAGYVVLQYIVLATSFIPSFLEIKESAGA